MDGALPKMSNNEIAKKGQWGPKLHPRGEWYGLGLCFEGVLLTWIVMVNFECSVHFFRGPCPTPLTNVRKKSFRTKTPNQRKSISLPRLFNLSAKLELLGLS